MNLEIDDKTALVAASSKGLGKACAMRLAREGAQVTICARNEDQLQQTANEIRSATGGEILAIQTDLTDPTAIRELVAGTRDEFGTIDILIANSGGPPVGEFEGFEDAEWQAAFELTLLSNIRLSREVLPAMADHGWGRVVYVSSIAVPQPLDGFILSNSVRAGVEGLSKTLSNTYAGEGVTVNCVRPGYTRTMRLEDLPDEELNAVSGTIPMGRLGNPNEFADVVAFLASERASYVTGEAVQVDGGFISSV